VAGRFTGLCLIRRAGDAKVGLVSAKTDAVEITVNGLS
jgi:hypothetical protein